MRFHKVDGATLIFQLSLPDLAPYLLFTNRLPGFIGPVPLPLLIRRYSVFCSVIILARVSLRVNRKNNEALFVCGNHQF